VHVCVNTLITCVQIFLFGFCIDPPGGALHTHKVLCALCMDVSLTDDGFEVCMEGVETVSSNKIVNVLLLRRDFCKVTAMRFIVCRRLFHSYTFHSFSGVYHEPC